MEMSPSTTSPVSAMRPIIYKGQVSSLYPCPVLSPPSPYILYSHLFDTSTEILLSLNSKMKYSLTLAGIFALGVSAQMQAASSAQAPSAQAPSAQAPSSQVRGFSIFISLPHTLTFPVPAPKDCL